MAQLKDRLGEELGNWKDRLPAVWRAHFQAVELDWDSIDPTAEIEPTEKIWPQETAGPPGAHVFKALEDLAPENVRVVIFGNDPYTRITQATGRSFEQGDVTDWAEDLKVYGRISPSYQSILCAAAATTALGRNFDLESPEPVFATPPPQDESWGNRPLWWCHLELARGVRQGAIHLPPPQIIFKHWADQGVFWLNTTLTYSKWDVEHRRSHHALWAPFTRRMLELLVETAAGRDEPMVFALWGSTANDLEPVIDDLGLRFQAPAASLRTVKTGHPQWPAGHWRVGNSLRRINEALGDEPIEWA